MSSKMTTMLDYLIDTGQIDRFCNLLRLSLMMQSTLAEYDNHPPPRADETLNVRRLRIGSNRCQSLMMNMYSDYKTACKSAPVEPWPAAIDRVISYLYGIKK